MHKIALSFAIVGLSAGAAFAQMDMSFADVDTDASGEVSFAELQVAWPDVTQEEFDAADTDTSSGLSTEEVDALQASMTPDAATMAPAAPMAPATTTPAPAAAPATTDAPVATDLDAGSTSSSETNSGGDAGAGN